MSKNKYKPESTVSTEGGERKQRDHTKTGKLAKRREVRRLEAIARQTRRIMEIERSLKGEKVDEKITAYISTFKNPGHALQHAQFTLQKVRGGVPHIQLVIKEAPVTPVPAVVEATAKPAEEKPKNKYRRKKLKRTESAAKEGMPNGPTGETVQGGEPA